MRILLPTLSHRENILAGFQSIMREFYDQNKDFPLYALLLFSSSESNCQVTHHRNSLEEFLEERLLSSFHFLLPFLSVLRLSSSHLSRGEPMLTVDGDPEEEKVFGNTAK